MHINTPPINLFIYVLSH